MKTGVSGFVRGTGSIIFKKSIVWVLLLVCIPAWAQPYQPNIQVLDSEGGGIFILNLDTGNVVFCSSSSTSYWVSTGRCKAIGGVGVSQYGYTTRISSFQLYVISNTTGEIFHCTGGTVNGEPRGGCVKKLVEP
jgi:hypothetical protein